MARLSFDGLLLQARMNAVDEMTITDIALNVFNGADPDNPGKVKAGALNRAARAALNLISMKQAVAIPDRKNMVAVQLKDKTNGGMQAQAIMNLVVRGGAERRKADRRAVEHPEGEERRDSTDRRAPDDTGVTETPPVKQVKRIVRKPLPKSPFDIKKNFNL